MAYFTDQLGRTLELTKTPQRLVSLVPSQTELLYDLGLENEVIGITKFCIHPQKWFLEKQRVGGTKNVNIQKIKSLQPDLIIANKEENVKEQVEELANHFPVWISDVNNLDDAYTMIKGIGSITAKTKEADLLLTKIKASFSELPTANHKLQTAYFIWKNPYMTVGGDTFIGDMLSKAGFQNMFKSLQRYPVVGVDDLAACEVLLLSSEPYPFKQKHIDELQKQLPATKILLVDGEMFSWYGSRLLHAPAYFKQLKNELTAIL